MSKARVIADQGDVVGDIRSFGYDDIPTGFLGCDGTAVSRTTYSRLFGKIGVLWGEGDGTPRTGSETQPYAVGVNYGIKY